MKKEKNLNKSNTESWHKMYDFYFYETYLYIYIFVYLYRN